MERRVGFMEFRPDLADWCGELPLVQQSPLGRDEKSFCSIFYAGKPLL